MKIPISMPTITRKELEGVLDCLINNELIEGRSIKAFESSVAEISGIKYPLAANSVTSAYHLIFSALEVNSESEVIMPSFMPQEALCALAITGGTPVLIDNDDNSIFPSAEKIKEKINDKTKAVIICHLFGYRFDLNSLNGITVPVIEDISHSLGADFITSPEDKKSSFAIISFAPSMIITTGQGGMVLTDNSKYYSKMRELRGGDSGRICYNYLMTDFQGAMGISQLSRLKIFIKRRQEIARIYHDALKITPHKTPFAFNESSAYQSFNVIFNAPSAKTIKYWEKNGVETENSLSSPLHNILGLKGLDYPNSDRMSKKLFSLPLYPSLTKKEIEKISRTLSSFI